MDGATREVLGRWRDSLIADVRRTARRTIASARSLWTPTFDRFTHTMDGWVALLISEQTALIAQLEAIDRRRGG
jgi:hypothetical protein